MQTLVESLKEKGEFASDVQAHALNLHLEAVSHYENTDQGNKVLKHMEGFKTLLEHQRNGELISEETYQTLYDNAEYLMGTWRCVDEISDENFVSSIFLKRITVRTQKYYV